MKIFAALLFITVLCTADTWQTVCSFEENGIHCSIEKSDELYRLISENDKETVTLLSREKGYSFFTRLKSPDGRIYAIIEYPDYIRIITGAAAMISQKSIHSFSETTARTHYKTPAILIEKETRNEKEYYYALIPLSGVRFERIALSVDTSQGNIQMNSGTGLQAIIEWDESGNPYGKLWTDTAEYALDCPYYAIPPVNSQLIEEKE